MPYTTYIKNYSEQQIELYFSDTPHYTVRSQLKNAGWHWNATKECWTIRLSRDAEKQAISIGASDGTPPNSNPEVATEQMDLNSIRRSMSTLFKDPAFMTYSLQQIDEYLNGLSGKEPKYVHVDQSSADGAVFVLADQVNVQFATVGIVRAPERVDECKQIYSIDSPFAQTPIRNVACSSPYVIYNNSVYGIVAVSDTDFIRSVINHTRQLNIADSYTDIWVYRLKRPCPNHQVQSVTAYVASDRSCVEQPINVTYCPVCQRYYINADQYRAFVHSNGLPYLRIQSFDTPDYSSWREESLLHYMGYNVSSVDGLSQQERWHILEHAVDTKAMSKAEVIAFLEFLIHQNENNCRFVNAVDKWRIDVQHIRNYRIAEQKYVRGRFVLKL